MNDYFDAKQLVLPHRSMFQKLRNNKLHYLRLKGREPSLVLFFRLSSYSILWGRIGKGKPLLLQFFSFLLCFPPGFKE